MVIGGENGETGKEEVLTSVEILNAQNVWKPLAPLNKKRECCAAVTIENKVFVFGGWNKDDNELNSCEMCDVSLNNYMNSRWTNLPNMKYRKQDNGIKYFASEKKIILVGGRNNNNNNNDNTAPKTIELYDLNKSQFIEYPQTQESHEHPAIVIPNLNLIYVIGNTGRNNNNSRNPWGIIEFYDIRNKKWNSGNELSNVLQIPYEDTKKRYFRCMLNCP